MFSRKIRQLAALAAAFGIALQALWPIIAQARPGDSISVPICSAEGTRHSIELPLGKKQSEKGTEHCKLCVLGTDKDAVVPARITFDFSSDSVDQIPVEKQTSKRLSLLLTACPRAPPQAS